MPTDRLCTLAEYHNDLYLIVTVSLSLTYTYAVQLARVVNKRPRPTQGACVAIVCMGDVDMCEGSRIDRAHYVGHCSNRPRRRASIHVKKQMDRYKLGVLIRKTYEQSNQAHRQTDKVTKIRVSSLAVGRASRKRRTCKAHNMLQ